MDCIVTLLVHTLNIHKYTHMYMHTQAYIHAHACMHACIYLKLHKSLSLVADRFQVWDREDLITCSGCPTSETYHVPSGLQCSAIGSCLRGLQDMRMLLRTVIRVTFLPFTSRGARPQVPWREGILRPSPRPHVPKSHTEFCPQS